MTTSLAVCIQGKTDQRFQGLIQVAPLQLQAKLTHILDTFHTLQTPADVEMVAA